MRTWAVKPHCKVISRGPFFHHNFFRLAQTRWFADDGRYLVTGEEADRGAFKTPTLRDITKHAPYMHDGSILTLREVVERYNKGGLSNPHLDLKMKPLALTAQETDALVAFMEALDGEGYQDTAPASFPE